MKIKGLLGLAAIYGAVRYAQKHGGFRQAMDELVAKAKDVQGRLDEKLQQAKEQIKSRTDQPIQSQASSPSSSVEDTGYGDRGTYGGGGYGGFGGNRS